jgi:phage shock protein PspC (stress-responsive transcriptional regulator)
MMSSPKRLYRNSAAGRVAGVCAGIADYLDADVTLIRLLWVVLSIVPGCFIGGLVAYVAAWAVMENNSSPAAADPSRRRLTRSRTDRKVGGVCGGLAEYLGVDSTVARVLWVVLTIFPGAFLLGIVAYIIAWFIMPESPAQEPTVGGLQSAV